MLALVTLLSVTTIGLLRVVSCTVFSVPIRGIKSVTADLTDSLRLEVALEVHLEATVDLVARRSACLLSSGSYLTRLRRLWT